MQLLEILESRSDFSPEAVAAAEAEIATRSLSDGQIEQAATEARRRMRSLKQDAEARDRIGRHAASAATGFIAATMNGVDRSARQQVRCFCVGLTPALVYGIVSNDPGRYALLDDPLFIALSVATFLWPAITIVLLWRTHRFGWTMATTWATVSLSLSILMVLQSLRANPSILPGFLPRHPTASDITGTLFHGLLLAFMNTTEIRELFTIQRTHQITVILLSLIPLFPFLC